MAVNNKYIENWIRAIDGSKSDLFYKNIVALTVLEYVKDCNFDHQDIIITDKMFYEGFERITNELLLNPKFNISSDAWKKSGNGDSIMGKMASGKSTRNHIMTKILEMPVYRLNTSINNKTSKLPITKNHIEKGALYDIHIEFIDKKRNWFIKIDKNKVKTIEVIHKPLNGYLLYTWAIEMQKWNVSDLSKTLKTFTNVFENFTRDVTYMKWSKDVLYKFENKCFYTFRSKVATGNKNVSEKINKYIEKFNKENISLDHYKPVKNYGEDKITNYTITSKELNSSKSTSLWNMFDDSLKLRNDELKHKIKKLIIQCNVPEHHAKRMKEDLGVK